MNLYAKLPLQMAVQAAILEMKQQANRITIALEIAELHGILKVPKWKGKTHESRDKGTRAGALLDMNQKST
jgi:hypothetical protein